MNPRTIIFVVVALAMAGGTALMVKGWMNAQQKALVEAKKKRDEGPKDEILVAKVNLPIGTLVNPKEHLVWQAWPSKKILKAYVRKGLRKPTDFAGSVVRSSLVAGEPITSGRVVKRGEKGFMAAVLSPGMRAISVKISATTGASGFIFPGDRVDVMMSTVVKEDEGDSKKKKKTEPARVTETILENVRVLAVDQIANDKGNKARVRRTATLEVTPKQAEFVTVAEALGTLSLALRPLTREDQNIAGIQLDPNDPHRREPGIRGRSHTTSAEVSSFASGVGVGGFRVTVIRGDQTEDVKVQK